MDKPIALLIEDDQDIATLFRHVLDIAGYYTEILSDGKDAMKRLSSIRPDIVLLDLQLPNLSGADILKHMREDESMKSIPVVVVTAFADLAENLPIEPDLVLTKPVNIKDLSNLINRIRANKDSMNEPSYDKVTGLLTEAFFATRLVFALERVRQSKLTYLGVLFAELYPLGEFWDQLSENELNDFLNTLTKQLKSTLRPRDAIAWSNNGYFLTLIEEITNDNDALMVGKRVEEKLSSFLQQHEYRRKLQLKTGVVLCNNNYESVQEILDDMNFARTLAKQETNIGPQLFDLKGVQALRDSQV